MRRIIRPRSDLASWIPVGNSRRSDIAHTLRCTSTAAAREQASDLKLVEEREPYGQEYGAGPSRIPYSAPGITIPTPRSSSGGRDAILRAREIRRTLAEQSSSPGHYTSTDIFVQTLYKAGISPLNEMSRLEIHTMLHHLDRLGRDTLAFSLITRIIDEGHDSKPRIRRLIHSRTLRSVLTLDGRSQRQMASSGLVSSPARGLKLKFLTDLLRSLQSVRHHRPVELYTLLVHLSVAQRRPDKAAEVFVGLVEEWVTEGRVAEGADIDGFHEGGGPPQFSKESTAKKHNSWWIGVRTWTLPGEVLSPHDRLDLWHPTKLSLGGKFKNFPFPLATSPPSMVPPPSTSLLGPILKSLRLDPKIASPSDFEASMRACAILANTILSRTLPLSSLGALLKALEATPSYPPVYPANLNPIPTTDAWAYEAFTQIHLALQSFFFSPPISAASFAQARANETILSGQPPTDHADKYRLQPLNFASCLLLMRYALEKMRSAKITVVLMAYIKKLHGFGGSKPDFWNTLLKGGTVLENRTIANVADDALFGRTALSYTVFKEAAAPRISALDPVSALAVGRQQDSTSPIETPIPPTPTEPERPTEDNIFKSADHRRNFGLTPSVHVSPDEKSLVLLAEHLGQTSQTDRLESFIYTLIPFLRESANDHEHAGIVDEDGIIRSGRQKPNHLTPDLYTAILTALSLVGKTGLAQRVYNLALEAETSWQNDHFDKYPQSTRAEIPPALRLPIPLFTAMLRVWANEVHKSREGGKVFPIGWYPPQKLSGQPRHIAAGVLARSVYQEAESRFVFTKQASSQSFKRFNVKIPSGVSRTNDKFGGGQSRKSTPDAMFFHTALQALSHHFGFHRHIPDLIPSDRRVLQRIVAAMERSGIKVPVAIHQRLEVPYGAYVGKLRPRDYRVYYPEMRDRRTEVMGKKLRGLAEGLMRANEEGLWRDKNGVERYGREVEGDQEEEMEKKDEGDEVELLSARG